MRMWKAQCRHDNKFAKKRAGRSRNCVLPAAKRLPAIFTHSTKACYFLPSLQQKSLNRRKGSRITFNVDFLQCTISLETLGAHFSPSISPKWWRITSSRAEHVALRESVGVIDLSFRSRICLTGIVRYAFSMAR